MTKVIYVCDRCKKEVEWVYDFPKILVQGKAINVYEGEVELCEDCAQGCIDLIKKYEKGEV